MPILGAGGGKPRRPERSPPAATPHNEVRLLFLVVECETPEQARERRAKAGGSSGESYQATLEQLVPDARVRRVAPADPSASLPGEREMARFDAVFVTGTPLHVYEDNPEVRRLTAFMGSVLASGTPSFGSCAGLQLAVAGGEVRPMPGVMEAGVSRRIVPTLAGRGHPMLAGRPPVWDAPGMHADEIASLPAGGTCLATNGTGVVQAAEIRHGRGTFWGVQYHPKLSIAEVADALRRQARGIVDQGLAGDLRTVLAQADLFDELADAPDDPSLRWRLGVDDEFAYAANRRREIRNFIGALPKLRRGSG